MTHQQLPMWDESARDWFSTRPHSPHPCNKECIARSAQCLPEPMESILRLIFIWVGRIKDHSIILKKNNVFIHMESNFWSAIIFWALLRSVLSWSPLSHVPAFIPTIHRHDCQCSGWVWYLKMVVFCLLYAVLCFIGTSMSVWFFELTVQKLGLLMAGQILQSIWSALVKMHEGWDACVEGSQTHTLNHRHKITVLNLDWKHEIYMYYCLARTCHPDRWDQSFAQEAHEVTNAMETRIIIMKNITYIAESQRLSHKLPHARCIRCLPRPL